MTLYTNLALFASMAALHSAAALDGAQQFGGATLKNCGFIKSNEERFIALPKQGYQGIAYDEMNCGACVEITKGRHIAYAQVVSHCEDCDTPQLSQQVYDDLTNSKWGEHQLTYKISACPRSFFATDMTHQNAAIEICFDKDSTAENPILQPVYSNEKLVSVKAKINKEESNFKVDNFVLDGSSKGYFFKRALLLSGDDNDMTSLGEMKTHDKHWLHVELAHVAGARAFTASVKINKKHLDNKNCVSLNGNFETEPETQTPTITPQPTTTPKPTPTPTTKTPAPTTETPAPTTETPSPTPAPESSGASAVATMTVATVMVMALSCIGMLM